MLIDLIEWLTDKYGDIFGSGLFNYITFRAGMAAIVSLMISMVFGGRIIKYLKRQQVGETVRDLGLKGQKEKEGTPTMGGIIIIMAILIPSLLLADLNNVYVILLIISTIWMAT
ncbi:MAG: phospho-N-acetylmuramoyl-pentapeptide-transferase, partial [Chitinophagales bacterium]|nr:phospho-N-acetylmuramoyl-pentapeptide-transferase [Chitinophagales bacterium]